MAEFNYESHNSFHKAPSENLQILYLRVEIVFHSLAFRNQKLVLEVRNELIRISKWENWKCTSERNIIEFMTKTDCSIIFQDSLCFDSLNSAVELEYSKGRKFSVWFLPISLLSMIVFKSLRVEFVIFHYGIPCLFSS